jgi:hypothetical protein
MLRIAAIVVPIQQMLVAVAVGCMLVLLPSTVLAEFANPLDTDPNADGLGFGLTDAFVFGLYGQDDMATFRGNDILVQSQNFTGSGNDGAGISIPVSNGENGYTVTFDTDEDIPDPAPPNNVSNPDVDNATAPNSVWTTIGNSIPPANGNPPNPVTGTPIPRLGLNNGNVIRYSMWVREDPNDPIGSVAPQIEPVLKLEFWKEGLSTFADTNPGSQPLFGDKVVDTDQHLGEGIWIDINNDGSVADASAAADGRIRTITSTQWTLIDVEYEVDDLAWLGIDDDEYSVADIEEVRAVLFWGDFIGSTLQGSLWFDNVLVEVFADQTAADATPVADSNPNPVLSEMPTADFDNDGDVDGKDFLTWQTGFGTEDAMTTEGDANYDGLVNDVDLGFWQGQFGNGGSSVAAIASVPEPSAMILALVGAVCLGRRATRRGR